MIQDDVQYLQCLAEIHNLLQSQPEPGTPASERLEALTALADGYEQTQ